MKLRFKKCPGKFDELTIIRGAGEPETVACPEQGIIPHDMVHYAVESTLAHRGFLSLLKGGMMADFATRGGESEEAVERLVETMQAEMWGGHASSTSDLIATYEHACSAREHRAFPVSVTDIEAIRQRIQELTLAWSAVELNEVLDLRF